MLGNTHTHIHPSLEGFMSNGRFGVWGVLFPFSLCLMQNGSAEPGNKNIAKCKRSEVPL